MSSRQINNTDTNLVETQPLHFARLNYYFCSPGVLTGQISPVKYV